MEHELTDQIKSFQYKGDDEEQLMLQSLSTLSSPHNSFSIALADQVSDIQQDDQSLSACSDHQLMGPGHNKRVQEMQNNEENRITQIQQHRSSTPEMLYGSKYGDQRELILGRRSFIESLPKSESGEASSEHELETASTSTSSDVSDDTTFLNEQNAKRQHF